MKWRLLLFFLALFLQSPFAQSPQIHTVTLGESLKLSLENSEQIKKARIDRQALEQRLREGRYRAPAVRRVHMPKGAGKTRPRGIPTFEDKVAQRTREMVLESMY